MDKLGRFCVLFATNAHKHSSYDAGAKSKFFANKTKSHFGILLTKNLDMAPAS